jgi:Plasmid pRiA4b ORF-3-like protein
MAAPAGAGRELHGVIQVAMGWEGIHLYQFRLRATRYGSLELSAASPDVTLEALPFRKGARFLYEYDLNIPWRHEVHIEDRRPAADMTYLTCTGGG